MLNKNKFTILIKIYFNWKLFFKIFGLKSFIFLNIHKSNKRIENFMKNY